MKSNMPAARRRRHAPRRPDPIERDADAVFLLSLRLQKLSTEQIYARYNAMRWERAYSAALEAGATEHFAREIADDSRLSIQTVRADFRRLKKATETSVNLLSKALVVERLQELELDRQTLFLAEQRAWLELERSSREALTKTIRRDVAVEESVETSRTEQMRSADPRWMGQIVSILAQRVEIDRERFRLKALLGLETPRELVALARSGDLAAAKSLRAHEVSMLYSLEARAAGIESGEVQRRFAMISAYLGEGASKVPGARRETVVFEVRGLEVDDEIPS